MDRHQTGHPVVDLHPIWPRALAALGAPSVLERERFFFFFVNSMTRTYEIILGRLQTLALLCRRATRAGRGAEGQHRSMTSPGFFFVFFGQTIPLWDRTTDVGAAPGSEQV